MTTRHWQITILKGGQPVRLYVRTSCSMIEEDLAGRPDDSLICFARQYHRHGQNAEQNHRDLAIGAVMKFAGASPYDISDTHISTCDAVPAGAAAHYVGGSNRNSLVPIWEELVETDE